MRVFQLLAIFLGGCIAGQAPAAAGAAEDAAYQPELDLMRAWVQDMKQRERGPFQHIRWFCKDGAILEPEPYACEDHGGGVQHGEWSERTRLIRDAGYPIANVLADLQPEQLVGPGATADFLSFLLMEKFLIAFDDGWIFRRARSYRGSLQDYNEQDSATAILLAMLGDPVWRQRFVVLREAARLLPHGVPHVLMTQIRGLASAVTEQNPAFANLRDKIHIAPDGQDAQRVRDFAASPLAEPTLHPEFERLAEKIDEAYTSKPLPAALEGLHGRVRDQALAARISALAQALRQTPEAAEQFRLSGDVLTLIREHLLELGKPTVRLQALDVSLIAGVLAFTASRQLLANQAAASRGERLQWLHWSARALYGMGLLTRYELEQLQASLAGLTPPAVALKHYRSELQYLELASGWSARRLAYHFGAAYEQLASLDPLASLYVPDRLRSSPLLFYSNILDMLLDDAARLSGVQHQLFGQPVSSGLRPLNAGLARGILYTEAEARAQQAPDSPAIWLVPETTADLPPVAGILTAAEGNALSHVQLLARNLGLPNVVIGRQFMDRLLEFRGQPIVVAVSPGGLVQIEQDGPQWSGIFARQQAASNPPAIRADLAKLDLAYRGLIPTSELGAADSGRRVGPKAAQVGELSRRFPGHVSAGLAIPFGVFRSVLEQPREPGDPQSMFAWMQSRYAEMARLDREARARQVPGFLAEVRRWIRSQKIDADLASALREAMAETFGPDGSYGVFVRSDTNIEDLPGFTGAGLNRTVPNVVGADHVIDAILEVWASPFTERAFGWRQGLMDQPWHVYASVLLHQSVPADKSGVMVTADLDTGDPEFLTIVTNAGVGGGVEGQAAETLRLHLPSGRVRLYSSATATRMRVLLPAGGSALVDAPAPERLLQPDELTQLADLARALPEHYPQLLDAQGRPAAADIEFGFHDGTLMLFQIRAFLRNPEATRNQYLAQMDAELSKRLASSQTSVDLNEAPAPPPSGSDSQRLPGATGTPESGSSR